MDSDCEYSAVEERSQAQVEFIFILFVLGVTKHGESDKIDDSYKSTWDTKSCGRSPRTDGATKPTCGYLLIQEKNILL